LEQSLKILGADLVATPLRISVYHDLPFAIFRYDPGEEFELRRRLRLFGFGLEQNHGKQIRFISLARLVWRIISECEGVDYLYKVEAGRGFEAGQVHVNNLLSSCQYRPIVDEVLAQMEGLAPDQNVVFLVRAGGFAPAIHRCSVLLDEMHHRTMVPSVLFYPGTAERATDLCFYDLPNAGSLGVYNYRVKVYGVPA
jgi:hypothetical protein